MPYFWGDPTFMMLIPAFIFALWAQNHVKTTYAKFSKVANKKGLTGRDVAKRLLNENEASGVEINRIKGKLTDNYDPRSKKLNLSEQVYSGTSIAAIGIAAHETGHAIQHSVNYGPLGLRSLVYPVAAFGSGLAFPLFFIGMFFLRSEFLMDLGIYLYMAAVAFTLITLPVEFNASARAIRILSDGGHLEENELAGARKVLNAAAMTYVAATAMAIIQLARLLILRGRD